MSEPEPPATGEARGLARSSSLEEACAAAWSEWEAGGDAPLWASTSADAIAGGTEDPA